MIERTPVAVPLMLVLAGCSPSGSYRIGPPAAATEAAVAVNPDFQGPLVDGLARAEFHHKWGFVNEKGDVVVGPLFAWAESFSGGLAAVKQDGRWGFIGRSGRLAIPAELLDADPFSEGLAAVRRADGWQYVNDKGAVVVAGPFVSARPFACGQARVRLAMAYRLGDRTHGEYADYGLSPRSAVSRSPMGAYEVEMSRDVLLRAASLGLWPASPTSALPGNHVDDVALTALYAAASANRPSMVPLPGDALDLRGLKYERQWDERVWKVIDRAGRVIPPASVKPCDADAQGGPVRRDAGPLPDDLAGVVARLHTLPDRSDVFQRLYDAGPSAIGPVVTALGNRDRQVRINALEILVRMGTQAAQAVPAVFARLDDQATVFYAAWALGRMGPAAVSAVPALLQAYPKRPPLIEAALLDIGASAAPALLAAFASASAPRDALIARLLGAVGATTDPAVQAALDRATHDRRPDLAASGALGWVRLAARSESVGSLAMPPRATVDAALMAGLADWHFPLTHEALAVIAPKTLADPKAPVVTTARVTSYVDLSNTLYLGLAGAGNPAIVPYMIARLHVDGSGTGVNVALRALEKLGPVAAEAATGPVTELLGKTASRASDDEVAPGQVYSDRDVGRCRTHDLALRALAAFGGTDAVLADAGDCPSAGHLRALLELGPRATKAVPSLLDSTAKAVRDGIARDALTVVLMAIGPSVLGPLVDRVKRPDAPLSLKTLLLRMVTRFPTDSAAALPVIAELAASDGSADMRKQADDVLSALRRREPTGGR